MVHPAQFFVALTPLSAVFRPKKEVPVPCHKRLQRTPQRPRFAHTLTVRVFHIVCVYICCVAQQVKGVILDPSCSGSGTTVSRMDHLLPSSSTAGGDDTGGGDAREQQRVEQLAKFQVRTPPLHFTCSSCIHHTTPHHATPTMLLQHWQFALGWRFILVWRSRCMLLD